MVQFKSGIRGIAPYALGALALYSCDNDDEVSDIKADKTDLLVGEWKLVEVDGESYNGVGEDYTYAFGFTFEADGDFGYCEEYNYPASPELNENYCSIEGSWEWTNSDQNVIIITDGGADPEQYRLEISVLTEDRLEGDYFTIGTESEVYSVVFEKYDFDD